MKLKYVLLLSCKHLIDKEIDASTPQVFLANNVKVGDYIYCPKCKDKFEIKKIDDRQ